MFAAHVGDVDAAAACVDATIETFGGLDILVNNAGDQPVLRRHARASTEARYDKTFEVNLRGPAVLVPGGVGRRRSRRSRA